MNSCQNCGSNINEGELFCKVCGTKVVLSQNNDLNAIHQTQNNSNLNNNNNVLQNNIDDTQQLNNNNTEVVQNSNSNMQQVYSNNGMSQNNNPKVVQLGVSNQTLSDNVINDDYLIDAYIGKNADKLRNGGFSINTLIFGYLYILYRKMWLLGFACFIGFFMLNLFLKSISGTVRIVIEILVAIKFKEMYLNHVIDNVNKIKMANPDKNEAQLMNLCSQKGGTTLVPIFIVIILYLLLFFIIFIGAIDKNLPKEQYDNTYAYEEISSNYIYNYKSDILW